MDALLERFCRYVKIESTAVEDAGKYPSSPGQLDVGKLLVQELREIGLEDVVQNEHGIVTATLPATVPDAPTIAWVSHVDTSPEFTGKDVKPVLHRDYDGKDIVLPGCPERVIRVSEAEGLAELAGKTIITSDGTTLLGADDKAGCAVIMEALDYLKMHPDIPHGPIRACFTCDEEIGHGVDHVDIKALGAVVAYTLDGEGHACVECETFSADLATVTVSGVNIHPGYGKNRMVNAVRIAAEFLTKMPFKGMSPETTSGREGFLHPYVIEGGVAEARIKILLRDFKTAALGEQRKMLESIAADLNKAYPKAKVELKFDEQYRNMADGMKSEPRAVELAIAALKAIDIQPKTSIIRGGTDGSRLTEMGLPTPNLATGMHNFHSPLEWACLEEMEIAVRGLVELARLWGDQRSS